MARHRASVDGIAEGLDTPFVLDAGTGMYLNTILLDVPIAPKVSEESRRRAAAMSSGAGNPRRASREIELELAGADRRSSIWSGELRYEVGMIYLRPERSDLDPAIARRSHSIVREGVGEARMLLEKFPEGIPNASVRDSVGVRELVGYAEDRISFEEAEQSIKTRTRRLSKRQTRWFDKLARTLETRSNLTVLDEYPATEERVREEILPKLQAYYS